ncbi:calcium-binding protein [Streptomyces sp. NPDC052023]|uniref:calcium-binding protein n=1 Tax=Streptomyces sp. NPDC052023 TaxID=3365681 RepID=UPI0037D760AD
MRIRATVAAVTGALALSALAAPIAQADPHGVELNRPGIAERFGTSSAKPSLRTGATAAPTITAVTVNSNTNVVVGTGAKTIKVYVKASHPSGISDAYIDLWHGSDPEYDIDGWLPPNEQAASCTASSATTSTCMLTITATPGADGDGVGDLYANILAGTWNVSVGVLANDGEVFYTDFYKTHKVQRASVLTVNAGPEPVQKGGTLTVTGKLTRADWGTRKYVGFSGQKVALQFRKSGPTSYANVKGITAATGGALKTTYKASYDGYWRFNYSGIPSTAAVSVAGDYVDVK